MREIDSIVVHCSDQATNYSIGWDKEFTDAESIRKFHIEHHGWTDIGYHWVITEAGKVEPGRSEEIMGAHVKGHNKRSIGVCLVTQDGTGRIAVPALIALRWFLRKLLTQYGLNHKALYTHNYFDQSRSCPGFSRKHLIELVRR